MHCRWLHQGRVWEVLVREHQTSGDLAGKHRILFDAHGHLSPDRLHTSADHAKGFPDSGSPQELEESADPTQPKGYNSVAAAFASGR